MGEEHVENKWENKENLCYTYTTVNLKLPKIFLSDFYLGRPYIKLDLSHRSTI